MRVFRQVLVLPGTKLTEATITALREISDEHPYMLQETELLSTHWDKFRNVDIIVASWQDKIDEQILQFVPRLQFIALRATTTYNVDMSLVRQRGIKVATISNYGDIGTAEFVIEQIFQCFRHERTAKQQLPEEIFGRTIALVGLGAVGSHVAIRASALGMHVRYFSPSGPKHNASTTYQYHPIEQLFKTADVISFHSPAFVKALADEQFNLIARSTLLIVTTLGLPFSLKAFREWQTARNGTSVFDLCAAKGAIGYLQTLHGVKVIEAFAARTPQSVQRAEHQLLQNCRNYLSGSL